jgi:preprotein translocase subunit SecD
MAVLPACKRTPVVRLVYRLDTAHPYDAAREPGTLLPLAEATMARRLATSVGKRSGTVRVEDDRLVVELASFSAEALHDLHVILGVSGRIELRVADEEGTTPLFGPISGVETPADSGISILQEPAPDGLDARGAPKTTSSWFARITCKPPTHADESTGACLGRLRAWTSGLPVPADRAIVFSEIMPDVATAPSGWRTHLAQAHADLTNDSLLDATVADLHDGHYGVQLTLVPSAVPRFEKLTAANVNRRLLIVIEGDVVESAPLLRQAITGSNVTIEIPKSVPTERQLESAHRLELVLRSGTYPAPIHLEREEPIPH